MKKPKKPTKLHLLHYVEDSSPKLKKFHCKDKLATFVSKFLLKYPEDSSINSGSWIDYCVMDVKGEVLFFTDGIEFK